MNPETIIQLRQQQGSGDDYATIKYNSSGVQQWVSRYNGPGNWIDKAYSIAVDGGGNVYVTGVSNGSGRNYDYATLKYNSSGVQQWVQRYNVFRPGNGADYAYSIAVDGSGNVYVTGGSWGSGTYKDYATIKYSQTPSGVYQTSSDLPENYSLSQNYPNPFNPITSIEFSLPSRGYVSLKGFNVLGREMAALVAEELNAGTYTTQWDGTAMPSGIYYYRLSVTPSASRDLVPTSRGGQTSGHSQTKKLVLLK